MDLSEGPITFFLQSTCTNAKQTKNCTG